MIPSTFPSPTLPLPTLPQTTARLPLLVRETLAAVPTSLSAKTPLLTKQRVTIFLVALYATIVIIAAIARVIFPRTFQGGRGTVNLFAFRTAPLLHVVSQEVTVGSVPPNAALTCDREEYSGTGHEKSQILNALFGFTSLPGENPSAQLQYLRDRIAMVGRDQWTRGEDLLNLYRLKVHLRHDFPTEPTLSSALDDLDTILVFCIRKGMPRHEIGHFVRLMTHTDGPEAARLRDLTYPLLYNYSPPPSSYRTLRSVVPPPPTRWPSTQQTLRYIYQCACFFRDNPTTPIPFGLKHAYHLHAARYIALPPSLEERETLLNQFILRLEEKISQADSGIHVKIPRLFHGTGSHQHRDENAAWETLKSILNTGIEVRHQRAFRGAFVSSTPVQGYGPYYFAFEGFDIHWSDVDPLRYFTNLQWIGCGHTIVVRKKSDEDNVTTPHTSVAFLTVPLRLMNDPQFLTSISESGVDLEDTPLFSEEEARFWNACILQFGFSAPLHWAPIGRAV